jgi:glycosyltransferase involved in cell wall biosynthesis
VALDFYAPATPEAPRPAGRGGYALVVSALAPYKRVEVAIAACERAGIELRVVGDGPERARLERLYPAAVFAGFRFGKDLASHLAAADVMVFPSRTDTFGLVNLEAMACGVPVAAYPVTGPIDVIKDGVTGALDLDLAAAALRALKIDPNECRAQALQSGWDVSSREFENNLVQCRDAAAGPLRAVQPKLILASRLVRESALDKASSSSIRPSRTRL